MKKNKRSTPLLEELEPRILFSADLPAVLIDEPLEDENNLDYSVIEANLNPTGSAASDIQAEEVETVRHELVFVDTNTPDHQRLIDDLLSQAGDSRTIDLILIDNGSNGIDQISEALAGYSDLDAVHIISHGSAGSIQLGTTNLTADSLTTNAAAIQGWSQAFSTDGDLLIYGCNLAASEDGQNLVDNLSQLTQADVGASDDLTGSTALGGDWDLEYQQGNLETAVAFSVTAQQQWSGILFDPEDIHFGTPGNDTIDAGSDNDLVLGGGGDDLIYGGTKNDVIHGGSGNDDLFGESGDDVLIAGGGGGTMTGGSGDNLFLFTGARNGDNYAVTEGTIDLSEFGTGNVSDNGSIITVNLGGGESFTISYSSIEKIIKAEDTGVNHAPKADAGPDQVVATSSLVTLDASGSNDPDSDTLFYEWIQIDGPSVTLSSTTAPSPTFTATATPENLAFAVVVSDGTTQSVDTVVINVTNLNDAPTTSPVTLAPIAEESGPRTITQAELLANASDPENDSLTATGLTISAGIGTLLDNGDGTWNYTPAANDDSSVSLSYSVTDGPNSVAGSASLDITPVNSTPINNLPVANDDGSIGNPISTTKNTPVEIDVVANDTDFDGTIVATTVVTTNPAHGTLSVNAATGVVTYTPDSDYVGTDSFTYTVRDNSGALSNSATVYLNVTPLNESPTAVEDSFTTTENSPVSDNVGINDTGLGNTPITYSLTSGTANGSLSFSSDGAFTYMPDAGFTGDDSFSYSVMDADGETSSANVTIKVNPPAVSPVAVADSYTTNENSLVQGNVGSNDSGLEHGPVAYAMASGPENGALSFSADGAFTYTPDTGFSGTDSFRYLLTDANGESSSTTVTITVIPNEIVVDSGPDTIDTGSSPETGPATDDATTSPSTPGNSGLPGNEEEQINTIRTNPSDLSEPGDTLINGRGDGDQVSYIQPLLPITLFPAIDDDDDMIINGPDIDPASGPLDPTLLETETGTKTTVTSPFGNHSRVAYSPTGWTYPTNTDIWTALDEMGDEISRDHGFNGIKLLSIEGAAGASVTFTAGYVAWVLRGGVLASSFLTSMPLWQGFDPIPVLSQAKGKKSKSGKGEKDNKSEQEQRVEMLLQSSLRTC